MTTMFDAMRGALHDVQQAVHGRAVTLHGPNIDDLVATAIIGDTAGTEASGDLGINADQSRSMRLRASDIGTVGDWRTVTIDDESWTIIHPPESLSATEVVFRVTRQALMEVHRSGYRG